nr:Dsec\GM13241-PA [Haemonchus contortus]
MTTNQVVGRGSLASEFSISYLALSGPPSPLVQEVSPRQDVGISTKLYDFSASHEEEAVDFEVTVPSRDMAELLIAPTPALQSAAAPSLDQVDKPKSELSPVGTPSSAYRSSGTPPANAVAPSADPAVVSTASKTGDLGKFSYANVVARQRAAAAAAETAAAQASAPLPTAPAGGPRRKRPANTVAATTQRQLPEFTPPDHTHSLIGSHPWANLVSLRNTPFLARPSPEALTALMPLDLYSHIPPGGYLSGKYVKRLFPHTFKEQPRPNRPLPVIELMRLEHAVAFRRSSQAVIDQLLRGEYVAIENMRPVTPEGSMPSTILPPVRWQFPVLYRVVNKGVGQSAVLEAKDFFIPGPDRRELHLIILDQYATNVTSNTRGFDRLLLSVKDFVWVYTVEPTRAALRDPETTLRQARIPKATALDRRFPHFFRVQEFTFVTPPLTTQRSLGIVLSLVVRYEAIQGLRIAFEGSPEAVHVSPTVCDFPLCQADQDEIVSALVRPNVSCAIRFSESPASKDAQAILCALVRDFLPAHPDEGILPLRVFKLTTSEKHWIADRAASFSNYPRNPAAARRRMAQLFNAACSALVAVNTMNDDKTTHRLTATVPNPTGFPFRFDFVISNMSSECGWTNHRPVYLWIVGSQSLIHATIEQSEHNYETRSIAVRLVVPAWGYRYAVRTTTRLATTRNNVTVVDVCVKLGPLHSGAEPLYELISHRQLFGQFDDDSRAATILDTVYGNRRTLTGPAGPPRESVSVAARGRSFSLRSDQIAALQMGDRGFPLLAIQAAFGTGKTLIAALIAIRTYLADAPNRVIATTTTNTAAAQFTDTTLSIDAASEMNVLRYVSDSALVEGAPRTPVDLHVILKRLPEDYGDHLSPAALATCLKYKRGRELLERFMFNRDLVLELSDAERDEYRLAERDISDLTRDTVAIMFDVRPPAILIITTSALLNSVAADGIFRKWMDQFALIIGDEASQIPEPALVALVTHIPQARHIYVGDIHQLEPHARCPRSSNPARFGAQGIMNILLAKGVPCAPLTTTFRAHPLLNDLPNLIFYDHTLVSGTRAEDRQMLLSAVRCPNPKLPFLFIEVPGKSAKALSGSHSNQAEAEICRQLVLGLCRKNVQPSSIAVIVFYKEQARVLSQFAKNNGIDLYTVDSVQGREKDIVILLTTRTGFEADHAEFLNDPHRLNVALSRCRHGQFVLGHEQSLTTLSYWHDILQWARNRRAVTTASALPDLLD